MSEIGLNSRWMLRIALYCLVALSSMFGLTCRMSRTEQPIQKEKKPVSSDESLSDSTLHLIRTAVMNNIGGRLSNEERKAVLETVPQVGQYSLGGEFRQYKWRWDLAMGRSVRVSFTGFIKSMDVNELQIAVIDSKK